MFRHQKLIAVCWAVLFAFALAGCSSSSDNQTSEPTEPTGPSPVEQELAELRAELAALRDLLGIDDDDDVGDSVTDLQNEITALKAQVQAAEDEAAAAAAKARTAELNKLASGITGDDGTAANRVRTANRSKGSNATDLAAPTAISGWSGASWSADNTTAVVYSNESSPSMVPFNQKWASLGSNGVYTLQASTRDGAAEHVRQGKLVNIPGLPAHASHPGLAVGPVQGVRGSFDGVPGTFKSGRTGSDAEKGTPVSVDADGNATWTEALTFTPDSNTASVPQRDSNYLSLGYWMTTKANGDIDVEVAAWTAEGVSDYNATDDNKFKSLIGKATFAGVAVGQYTNKGLDSVAGGAFNADATLVVDFAANTGANAEGNGKVSGTIDGFMSNGEALGSDWKVALKETDILDTGLSATGVSVTGGSAEATLGNLTLPGDWQATFVDGDRNDKMPGAVGGDFRINSVHTVSMIGAFVAINQEADQPDN